MENTNFKVYQHKTPNGKYYIGITSLNVYRRWQNGLGYKNQFFGRAVIKYGWDNIEHKVLYEGLNQKEAELIEEDLIYYYKQQKLSYNVDNGSISSISKRTEESKKKLSDALKKKWQDPEFREKMRLSNSKRKGTKNKMTPERIFKQEQKLEKLELKRKENLENKIILQYNLKGEFVKEWNNATEIANFYNVTNSNITYHLKNKTKTCCNYIFKYKNDDWEVKPIIKRKEIVSKKKPDFIFKYDTNNNLIDSFNSINKAAKSIKVSMTTFNKHIALNNNYKNFIWKIIK